MSHIFTDQIQLTHILIITLYTDMRYEKRFKALDDEENTVNG